MIVPTSEPPLRIQLIEVGVKCTEVDEVLPNDEVGDGIVPVV